MTYQRIRDVRDQPDAISRRSRCDLPDGAHAARGHARSSRAANELDQDIIELTDDFTFTRGNHTLTVGTHNEFFKFRNLFIRDNFGTYRFAASTTSSRASPSSTTTASRSPANPQQAAEFSGQPVRLLRGRPVARRPALTLTYGVRVDMPSFPDKPTANPAAVATFGYGTDVVPRPHACCRRARVQLGPPRRRQAQVRGGVGLFTGRTPYVWLSNQYGNTGIEFPRIGASVQRGQPHPVRRRSRQPARDGHRRAARRFTNEIDVIDPDYKYPSLLRGNLAYDHDLGLWGLVGTVEFFGLEDPEGHRLPEPQPRSRTGHAVRRPAASSCAQVSTAFSDVILLTNTDRGQPVERQRQAGAAVPQRLVCASGSYIYGRASRSTTARRARPLSNWR